MHKSCTKNTAHACILYKGHSKDKTSAKSYRTISTCPFIAKALDFYVRELSHSDWEAAQADTQYLGVNKSHKLGALLLTETISHSLNELNLPVFCLFLDARSAFDLTIRQLLIRKLHSLGTTGQRLVYLDNRLKCRKTFMEWDRRTFGPIHDELGFEQGGISSGDLYICYNNEQVQTAQDSGLGVPLGPVEVAAIGQADDVVLISNDMYFLKFLLQLTLEYCEKYHVTLAPEKTKLVAFSTAATKQLANFQKLTSTLSIENTPIEFADTAEHVGIIRSPLGNIYHIQNRVTAHNRALFSVLPAGLARNHTANPAASLKVESLHALPVLLSGVAPLILLKAEIAILHSHHKKTLLNLQKLPKNTPESFVMFLAGSLGATANIHMRQLGLFGMICRLPQNILYSVATSKLSSEPDDSSSWFIQIRQLCTQYSLPSPLSLLSKPPSKTTFKNLVKSKVTDFWKKKYELDANERLSLKYFQPQFYSLTKPHPLWTTCSNNPFETNKALVVSRLLSGQYASDWHARNWSKDNPEGFCLLCPGRSIPGDIEHLLLDCEALEENRVKIAQYWKTKSEDKPHLQQLLSDVLSSSPQDHVQFLLDPSVVPSVISGCQRGLYSLEEIFPLTRTYCYAMHRRRLQLLGRFKIV